MEAAIVAGIKIEPVFDMEEFMEFARETRMATETLEKLIEYWERWQPELRAAQIKHGGNSWVAIWLPEEIEGETDRVWERSPGEGFLINALAQYMCMAAVRTILPQAADGGCAPSPKPNAALDGALAELGLMEAGKGNGGILRRYAVLTYYPFRGGCEICAMQEDCPKSNGAENFASIVLPGHERGTD